MLHDALVEVPGIDILCKHLLSVSGKKSVSVGKFGQERNAAVRFDGGQQRFCAFAETEHTRIIYVVFGLVCLKIFLTYSQINVHQTARYMSVGSVFSLEQFAKISKTTVGRQFLRDACRQTRINVGIIRITG